MMTLSPIERAVLSATAKGPETFEVIYQNLHAAPTATPLADTAEAVQSLIQKGLLELLPDPIKISSSAGVSLDAIPIWRAPIEATSRGREVLSELRPSGAAWPRGERARLGMFEGQLADIPIEVFKENRREMSPRYSRELTDE